MNDLLEKAIAEQEKLEEKKSECEEQRSSLDDAIMALKGISVDYGFRLTPNRFIDENVKGGVRVQLKLYRRYKGKSMYINCADLRNIKSTIEDYIQQRRPDFYQEIVVEGK